MCDASTAGNVGNVGTGLQVAGAITSVFGAYKKSSQDQSAYEYQSAVNRNNAAYAEFQAQDAITRGETTAENSQLKYGALAGSQRAHMAANGVDVNQGSASNILKDTQFISDVDSATIRDNAIRAAWGFKVQAQNYSDNAILLQNRADAESPATAAFSQLLTSGATVADSWYRRNTPNPAAKA